MPLNAINYERANHKQNDIAKKNNISMSSQKKKSYAVRISERNEIIDSFKPGSQPIKTIG